MLGSVALEVVIGLILVFLIVSLICTAVREAIEAFLKDRAETLERMIRSMLEDPKGTGKAAEFFQHGLIFPLFRGEYDASDLRTRTTIPHKPGNAAHKTIVNNKEGQTLTAQDLKMRARSGLPSYIPARSVALAILDISAKNGSGPDPLSQVRDSLGKLPPKLASVLRTALDSAEGDLERVRQALEDWYDSAMDRASGWYKRRSQYIIFPTALAIAVVLNIDSLTIANRLSTDNKLREAVVAEAEVYATESAKQPAVNANQSAQPDGQTPKTPQQKLDDAKAELRKLGLPIGWAPLPQAREACPPAAMSCWSAEKRRFAERIDPNGPSISGDAGLDKLLADYRKAKTKYDNLSARKKKIEGAPPIPWEPNMGRVLTASDMVSMGLGWLITALAAVLGAPFWFDMLNKVMVIRSTVKPHEKSPEEGSEDRRDSKQIVVQVPPAPPPPPPPPPPPVQPPPADGVTPAPQVQPPPPQPPAGQAADAEPYVPNEWAATRNHQEEVL